MLLPLSSHVRHVTQSATTVRKKELSLIWGLYSPLADNLSHNALFEVAGCQLGGCWDYILGQRSAWSRQTAHTQTSFSPGCVHWHKHRPRFSPSVEGQNPSHSLLPCCFNPRHVYQMGGGGQQFSYDSSTTRFQIVVNLRSPCRHAIFRKFVALYSWNTKVLWAKVVLNVFPWPKPWHY